MISAMIEAGMIARRQSKDFRDVEIVITEVGLVVRGTDVVNDHKASASLDVDWSTFEVNPSTLPNAVRLVADSLDAKK